MPGAKDELRAEIAALREELAAERAKVEVLREQAARSHGCHPGSYWCTACNGLRWPGHACTRITWTSQPCQVTGGTAAFSQPTAGAGLDMNTYVLS